MNDNVNASSKYTIADWVSYFRNGIERYNRSPIVHQVVDTLAQTNDPSPIIDQLCEMIDMNQKTLEEIVKRTSPTPYIITPESSMASFCNHVLSVDPAFMLSKDSKHVLGISTDGEVHSYCLGRWDNEGNFEVLLTSKLKDKWEFDREVENLSKYFNAELIKEK